MAHTHEMTKRDFTALGRYVRDLADQIGLRDWWIELMHEPPDDDERALATCLATYGRKLAQVRVCHEFRHLEPVKQRWILVHELLHCHFAVTQDVIRGNRLRATMGELAHGHFEADWMQAHEYAIDGVACEWAKTAAASGVAAVTRHADVERLMAEAIEAVRRRDAIRAALDALPLWQRRALEERCAVEFLQRVAA